MPTISVHGVLHGIRHLVDTRRGIMPRSLDDDPNLVLLNYIGVATDLPAAEKNRISACGDARRVRFTDDDVVYAVGLRSWTDAFTSES